MTNETESKHQNAGENSEGTQILAMVGIALLMFFVGIEGGYKSGYKDGYSKCLNDHNLAAITTEIKIEKSL